LSASPGENSPATAYFSPSLPVNQIADLRVSNIHNLLPAVFLHLDRKKSEAPGALGASTWNVDGGNHQLPVSTMLISIVTSLMLMLPSPVTSAAAVLMSPVLFMA